MLSVYRQTRSFPSEEKYGLTSQLRRAAVSIATNLAEGCGRGSDADFGRFVQIAKGSASEVEYLQLAACDLGYLDDKNHRDLADKTVEIKRMLAALLRRLAPARCPTTPATTKLIADG